MSIHDGQPVNGDIGARVDLKEAKVWRAASGAALKRRSEVWRHKEIATRAARSLRERFIGVCGKLNFLALGRQPHDRHPRKRFRPWR